MLVWDKISGPGSSYAFTHELILFAAKDTPCMKGSNIFRSPGFSGGAKKQMVRWFTQHRNQWKLSKSLLRILPKR